MKKEWFRFEGMPKVNIQAGMSYTFFYKKDYLQEYIQKVLGIKDYPQQELVIEFKKGSCVLYYCSPSIDLLADKICKKTFDNPKWALKINSDVRKRSNALFRLSKKMLKTDFSKFSDKKLSQMYYKYYSAQVAMHSAGWYGNMADYDGIYAKKLLNLLVDKVKGTSISVQEALQILTSTKELSFAMKEELDLLESIIIIKKLKAEKTFTKRPETKKHIEEHTKKHGWLAYGHEGPGWGEDYFIERIQTIITEKASPEKLIQELKNKIEQEETEKKELIKKLELNKKDQNRFKVFSQIMFLKGYRKDSMFFGAKARDYLFSEIVKRKNLTIKEIWYVKFEEMNDFILKNKFSKKELKQRFDYYVMHYQAGKGFKSYHGLKGKEFLKKLPWQKKETKEVTELKGMCASIGTAKGKVKIICLAEDMIKMNKGDILVSEATNPELLPAMKKAAAIVTNIGGITCHAAIVSRELGVPCVIGTKNATNVLKDGDLVEVDANKGIVRKIK